MEKLGLGESYRSVLWFWSDQYELGLQVSGLADEGSRIVRRELEDGGLLLFHLAEDGRLVAVSGLSSSASLGKEIKLGERLIARQAMPASEALADPTVRLKFSCTSCGLS